MWIVPTVHCHSAVIIKNFPFELAVVGRALSLALERTSAAVIKLLTCLLVQNRSDAQKALSKNGMQINGVLIVGVKPVDPGQRQFLNDRLNNQGFMPLPLAPLGKSLEPNPLRASPRPYYLQDGSNSARPSAGTIATPAKSVVSKIMDLMFWYLVGLLVSF